MRLPSEADVDTIQKGTPVPNPITPDHIYQLVATLEPSLSPDGKLLVFARSQIDKGRMESISRIMMMSLPDGQADSFTQGESDTIPRFSPDGETIAFARPDDRGRKQLWLIGASGGEAHRITDVAGGVYDHVWSPDSSRIAFTSDVDPKGAAEDASRDGPSVKVITRVRYRTDNMGWRGGSFRQLFVADANNEVRQVTQGEGDAAVPAWSPDGGRIAFISDRRSDRDTTWHAEVYVIPAEGGEPEEWSGGISCYSQGAVVGAVTWSPGGDKLAVIGTDDHEISDPRQAWLFVVEKGQAPKRMTDGEFTPLLPTSQIRWTDDGRILFLGDRRGLSYLCEVPAEGGPLRTISNGGAEYTHLTLDARAEQAVVRAISPDSSGHLRLLDTEDGSESTLTHYNDDYFAQHKPATMEKFTITRGGLEIESRLLFPHGFDPSGGKYPLVLDIHGGPHGRFSDSSKGEQQVIATAGYLVLAVNPRGSSSYGPEFAKAVLGDWGGEDYLDIMAAVDEVCARPYVDENRLGVNGYSYGGFMSSWIVGHTTRFAAAVVGAPCINLASMAGTSDIGISFGETQWGGSRTDIQDALAEHSPLTYAPNVETPVLLMHGEEDYRCPIEQSEQYFAALKRLGKEVEFVRFPGSRHMFFRAGHPKMREEYQTRMLEWFERYLGGGPSQSAV